jgi:hypothetical protein
MDIATLKDEYRNPVSLQGAVGISTSIAKFGAGSADFGGALSKLVLGGYWTFTGDFTVQCWIYPTSAPAFPGGQIVGDHYAYVSAGWMIYWATSGAPTLYVTANNAYVLETPFSPTLNTWHHIAVTRSGNTIRLFVNGNEEDSAAVPAVITAVYPTTIGNDVTGSTKFNGYIDELSINNGYCEHSSSFTPPTAPDPYHAGGLFSFAAGGNISVKGHSPGYGADDYYTVSLLHFDSGISDDTGKQWYAAGSATTGLVAKFGAGAASASSYADYIYCSDSDDWLFPGDFSIDCWFNPLDIPVGLSAVKYLWYQLDGPAIAHGIGISYSPVGKKIVLIGSTNYYGDITVASNTWTHIAVSVSSDTYHMFQDGSEVASGSYGGHISAAGNAVSGVSLFGFGPSEWPSLIDELRITKGIARWTASFTPPISAYTAARRNMLEFE